MTSAGSGIIPPSFAVYDVVLLDGVRLYSDGCDANDIIRLLGRMYGAVQKAVEEETSVWGSVVRGSHAIAYQLAGGLF